MPGLRSGPVAAGGGVAARARRCPRAGRGGGRLAGHVVARGRPRAETPFVGALLERRPRCAPGEPGGSTAGGTARWRAVLRELPTNKSACEGGAPMVKERGSRRVDA